MATVKFTGTLSDDIKQVFNKAYKPQLDALTDKMKTSLDADVILDTYIKNTGGFDAFEKAKVWFNAYDYLPCSYIGDSYVGRDLKFKGGARFAPSTIDKAMRDVDDSVKSALAGWLAARDSIREIHKEIGEKFESVRKIFMSYPSVNTAVKMHPDLEHLLPQHIKEKMAEKTVRNKADAVEVSIDTSMIKQVAVMSKLAQQGA